MATQKQIEANRRNALKSTGPRTDEGKARVKFNALRHGVRAETLALPHEHDEEVQTFVDDVITAIAPRDAVEAELAAEIATLSWKLRRAERIEHAYLSKRIMNLELKIRETEEERAGWELEMLAYDDDAAGQRRRRYVGGIRNSLARARKELVQWRKMQEVEEVEQVEVAPEPRPAVAKETGSAAAKTVEQARSQTIVPRHVPPEIGFVRQSINEGAGFLDFAVGAGRQGGRVG